MSRIILIILYVILVSISGYNLYSFKPDVGMGITLSKGMSENLQNYIIINNIGEEPLKNINVLVNDNYYLHIYEIEANGSYNAFSTEFLEIKVRPNFTSRIVLDGEENVVKRLEKANKIFNETVEVSIFNKGDRYHKKL